MIAFVQKHAKLIGFLISFVTAGLAACFPEHASALIGASTTLVAAVGIKRPGDVREDSK